MKMSKRQRTLRANPDMFGNRDRAYLKAFRDGFDPAKMSGTAKIYTAEEIAEYERERGMNLT